MHVCMYVCHAIGVRDYIHVMDLAEGHLAALRFMQAPAQVVTIYTYIDTCIHTHI